MAATKTWVGGDAAGPSLWNVANNWSPASVPGSSDDIVIPATANNPTMNVTVTVKTLTVSGSAAILTLDGSHNLSVIGAVAVSAASAQIKTNGSVLTAGGSLSGSGKLDMSGGGTAKIAGDLSISSFGTGGLFVMNGSSQTIYYNYTFNNLQIGTASSTTVSLASDIRVNVTLSGSGTLKCNAYSLTLLGDITLKNFNAGTGTVYLFGYLYSQSQDLCTCTFYNLVMHNLKTYLMGNVTVTNNLDFEGGCLLLRSYSLTISTGASVTWDGSADINTGLGYFVTCGSGKLTMTASSSGTIFPVGYNTSMYNPVTITPALGSAICDVSVSQGITDADGATITEHAVNQTWVVIPHSAIDDVMITFQWTDGSNHDSDQELSSFNHYYSYVTARTSLTNPSPWAATSYSSAATGGNPWSRTSGDMSMQGSTTYYFGVADAVSALPVTIKSFDIKGQDGGIVALNWATSSEINNNYFEIERSVNGTEWTVTGKVNGNGTTATEHQYSAEDNLAGVAPGVVYYRLKQVDYNGTFSYSVIRTINNSASLVSVKMYPNPARNTLNLAFSEGHRSVSVSIMNLNGSVLFKEAGLDEAQLQKSIDIASWPAGTYFVKVEADGTAATHTLIKN